MEADETKNPATEQSTGYTARLSKLLAAGCCVLPVAIMFGAGLMARWVSSLGISDVTWSWIALGAFAAGAAVFVRLVWNRRVAANSEGNQRS